MRAGSPAICRLIGWKFRRCVDCARKHVSSSNNGEGAVAWRSGHEHNEKCGCGDCTARPEPRWKLSVVPFLHALCKRSQLKTDAELLCSAAAQAWQSRAILGDDRCGEKLDRNTLMPVRDASGKADDHACETTTCHVLPATHKVSRGAPPLNTCDAV